MSHKAQHMQLCCSNTKAASHESHYGNEIHEKSFEVSSVPAIVYVGLNVHIVHILYVTYVLREGA